MATLYRDPAAAAAEPYDLIIVGGGIYGAMTALEAARRGMRPLLLERDDYGGATSWNSHRIVHGGLRYLQRLDLGRFRTSVRERGWFLRHFPDLVEPLPCLMPLYGHGARRPSILRAALLANHVLSRRRNDGVRSDRRIESGGVMTVPETRSLFPSVRTDGLRGGALWYDAVMTDPQRLLIEVLRWASVCGARCLNYVEAEHLRVESGRVVGIEATDRVDGTARCFDAPIVVNCAGPWSGPLADAFDRPVESLFRPSLAFNLLFDRPPPAEVAIAVSAPAPNSHTWFLYPRRGRTYAGTAHFPCAGDGDATPSRQQVDAVIADLNAAVPGLDLQHRQVLRVYSGLLPATAAGSRELTSKPVIHDHGAAGGAAGLFSVSGVKYTTARNVAERTLRTAFAGLAEIGETTERPSARQIPAITSNAGKAPSGGEDTITGGDADPQTDAPDDLAEAVRRFVGDEAVVHLDDLLLRRGSWGDDPRTLDRTGRTVGKILGWDEARLRAELERLAT